MRITVNLILLFLFGALNAQDKQKVSKWPRGITYEIFVQSFADSDGDGIGDINVVDGYSEGELLTEDIKSKRDVKVKGLTMRSGISDSDNPRLNIELRKLGMSLQPIQKQPNEKKSWDETMSEAMASYGRIQKGTGLPRLYVNKNISWLHQQIENLKWLEQKKVDGVEIVPQWNDHRKSKLPGTEQHHHFDGIYCLAYFCVYYNKPIEKETEKPVYKPSDSVIGI